MSVTAKEGIEASLAYHGADKSKLKLIKKGMMPFSTGSIGTLFSEKYTKKEFKKRGLSVHIEAESRKESDPENLFKDSEYILELPEKYFVVAKRIE